MIKHNENKEETITETNPLDLAMVKIKLRKNMWKKINPSHNSIVNHYFGELKEKMQDENIDDITDNENKPKERATYKMVKNNKSDTTTAKDGRIADLKN